MELLVRNATVVTMDPERRVLRDADILVRDGRIERVGKVKGGARAAIRRLIDAKGLVVVPGFVHGHIHACQTLFRGMADGLELLEWLAERIYPLESAHDPRSMRASARLAFAELIRSGATAALDMGTVRHTDTLFEEAAACGFRLTSGKAMMDVTRGLPAGLRESAQESMTESLRLIRDWHGTHEGRLRYAFAPRFVLTSTEGLLREVAEASRALGLRVHTHASETSTECSMVRDKTGLDTVSYFHELGLLTERTTLAHGVWLTSNEQRLLRESSASLCHCPSSNLKLAAGVAKIPELWRAGVQLCLGADGAACGNNLDMFTEMRLAALMHLPRVGADGFPPAQVLEMATLGGARALGLESELGSIEVGKRADLTMVDLSGLHGEPDAGDPIARLVYSGRASDVRNVLVEGRPLLRDGELTTLDEPAIRAAARREARRIAAVLS